MTGDDDRCWVRIKRGGNWGPWHIVPGSHGAGQSLCGSRMTGFNKVSRPAVLGEELEGATCGACVKHQENGTRRAWRRR